MAYPQRYYNAINIREVVKDQLLRKGIVNISSIDLCTLKMKIFTLIDVQKYVDVR